MIFLFTPITCGEYFNTRMFEWWSDTYISLLFISAFPCQSVTFKNNVQIKIISGHVCTTICSQKLCRLLLPLHTTVTPLASAIRRLRAHSQYLCSLVDAQRNNDLLNYLTQNLLKHKLFMLYLKLGMWFSV